MSSFLKWYGIGGCQFNPFNWGLFIFYCQILGLYLQNLLFKELSWQLASWISPSSLPACLCCITITSTCHSIQIISIGRNRRVQSNRRIFEFILIYLVRVIEKKLGKFIKNFALNIWNYNKLLLNIFAKLVIRQLKLLNILFKINNKYSFLKQQLPVSLRIHIV